jgi:predicted DNA binding CopG/RHH family protein
MATPRKKRVDASPAPEMSTPGLPPVYEDVVIGLIPALQEIVTWWQDRKATLEQAQDASRQTERITFHVEQRWIEAIRRQADLDGFTYTQIVNEAFRQYFEGL